MALYTPLSLENDFENIYCHFGKDILSFATSNQTLRGLTHVRLEYSFVISRKSQKTQQGINRQTTLYNKTFCCKSLASNHLQSQVIKLIAWYLSLYF